MVLFVIVVVTRATFKKLKIMTSRSDARHPLTLMKVVRVNINIDVYKDDRYYFIEA